MRVLLAWGVALINALHYLLFKLRLLRLPRFRNYPRHWEPFLGSLLGWPGSMTVLHPERCPSDEPVVFAALHAKLDDPLFLWGAVHRATRGAVHIYFMMRDDFFRGWPWDYLPFSMNELTEAAGCIQISRGQISLAQLKPLINVLAEGESFVMFPGRTRSRSGLAIEYREGIEEPGGVSFFLLNGTRRAGRPVAAVPVARTYDPVDRHTWVVFGEPRYLPEKARREVQRDFDHDLAVAMSDLVVVTTLHAMCALLYLRVLHGRTEAVSRRALCEDVRAVLGAIRPHCETEPEPPSDTAIAERLHYLERHAMLRIDGDAFTLLPDRILACPEIDTKYRKKNPVKYHANQVLHLKPVVEAAEDTTRSDP